MTGPVDRGWLGQVWRLGDGWDRLVAELHEADAPFADRLAALRDELVAVESLLEHPLQPIQVCHCDLFADNVRATSNGLCVIEWDHSGPQSPTHELAVGLVEFGHTAKRIRCLVEAYEDAGGPGRIRRPEDFTMAIAQLGHIGEFVCREWLRAESESDLEFASNRVEEFLSEPVTRSLVDDLLDAVASQ
jgi:thiamine kinase-like enzyme